MRERKMYITLLMVVGVLVLGVAYAAITNVTLNIQGNVMVTPNQGNFKVAFTGTPTATGTGSSIQKITGDRTATIDVSGLDKKGDTRTVVFNIINTSTDITAYLSSTALNNNIEYFKVTSTLGAAQIAPINGTTTLTVKIELRKTPITEAQKDSVNIELIASPEEICTHYSYIRVNNSKTHKCDFCGVIAAHEWNTDYNPSCEICGYQIIYEESVYPDEEMS